MLSHRHTCSVMLLVLGFSFLSGICVSQGLRADVMHADPADSPRTVRDYRSEDRTYPVLSVPREALSKEQVEQWMHILDASDAQRQFILREYEEFVARHNALLDQKADQLWRMGAELHDRVMEDEGLTEPNTVRLANRLRQACMSLRPQLTAIEHEFIDLCTHILTESQRERVFILRNAATRRNCRTYTSWLPWSHVELRTVWEHSAADLADASERAIVEDILAEYEATLTTLVCRRADLEFEIRRRGLDDFVALEQGALAHRDYFAQLRQRTDRRMNAHNQVFELNEGTVTVIADEVSDEAAAEFLMTAKRAAFPQLYPDPFALRDLFQSIAHEDGIDQHLQELMTPLFIEYEARYDEINTALEEAYVGWRKQRATLIQDQDAQQTLHETWKAHLTERRDLAVETLHELAAHPAIADHLREHIDHVPGELRESITMQVDADSTEK